MRAVAAGATGQVITNVIKASLPDNAGRITKAYTMLGGFIISSMVGDAAADYVSKEVDKFMNRKEKKADLEE